MSAVLAVVGEPGIGKSSLLEEARAAADGFAVLHARGVESEAQVPFGGLLELLRPALGRLGSIPGPQADALGRALALQPGPTGERFAVGAATLSLLAAEADERPVLVLLDDAHWLDDSSAAALLFAIRRLVADPIAVLVAVRSGRALAARQRRPRRPRVGRARPRRGRGARREGRRCAARRRRARAPVRHDRRQSARARAARSGCGRSRRSDARRAGAGVDEHRAGVRCARRAPDRCAACSARRRRGERDRGPRSRRRAPPQSSGSTSPISTRPRRRVSFSSTRGRSCSRTRSPAQRSTATRACRNGAGRIARLRAHCPTAIATGGRGISPLRRRGPDESAAEALAGAGARAQRTGGVRRRGGCVRARRAPASRRAPAGRAAVRGGRVRLARGLGG